MNNKGLSSEPVYTISIAAEKLNISVHALRLYEREGLIIPYRTKTNRRIYSDIEIKKVECIKDMIKNKGLNFEGIRQLISLIPCWKYKKCSIEKRKTCAALQEKGVPCWMANASCASPEESCRDCIVYQSILGCEDVHKLVHPDVYK